MLRNTIWAVPAVLAAFASAGHAAEPPTHTTVFAKLFGPSKPKAGPVARGSTPTPRTTVQAPPAPEVVAESLRAEQDALDRRMTVCLKLREIAMQSNDESLMRQVDDLERQAMTLYKARTGAIGLPKSALQPLETPADVKVAAKKLTAPAAPTAIDPAVRTAEARTPRDVIREVKP
jgi:hypothetical protein